MTEQNETLVEAVARAIAYAQAGGRSTAIAAINAVADELEHHRADMRGRGITPPEPDHWLRNQTATPTGSEE